MKLHLISLLAVFSFSLHVLSKDNEEPTNEKEVKAQAMKDTQNFLKDSSKIKELSKTDNGAKTVDQHVQDVAGSESNANEMYSISADVLPILMEMNQDNPDKALESLNSYAKDPAAFLKSLPPSIRSRIEALSKKIEKQKGKDNIKK